MRRLKDKLIIVTGGVGGIDPGSITLSTATPGQKATHFARSASRISAYMPAAEGVAR
jgi:N-acetylmuramoyl-L-alanine amidase